MLMAPLGARTAHRMDIRPLKKVFALRAVLPGRLFPPALTERRHHHRTHRIHRPTGIRQGRPRGLHRPRRHHRRRVLRSRQAGRQARRAARRRRRRRACRCSVRQPAQPRGRGRRCARSTPTWASWPTCCSSRRRPSSTSRATARSSSTRRCCRCTAGRRRSAGRSRWARRETGITIFRPTDGLDEGPVILQKTCAIGPDDTLGEVYFNKLFPLGVAGAAGSGRPGDRGQARRAACRTRAQATYEGWMHDEECADPLAAATWTRSTT